MATFRDMIKALVSGDKKTLDRLNAKFRLDMTFQEGINFVNRLATCFGHNDDRLFCNHPKQEVVEDPIFCALAKNGRSHNDPRLVARILAEIEKQKPRPETEGKPSGKAPKPNAPALTGQESKDGENHEGKEGNQPLREKGQKPDVNAEERLHAPEFATRPESLLLLTLFYMKTGVTYDVLGVVFGMDGSSAQRNFEKGMYALQRALDNLGLLPAREFGSIKEFEEHMKKEEKLLLDATEIRVVRPSDNESQKDMYSGKKKHIR